MEKNKAKNRKEHWNEGNVGFRHNVQAVFSGELIFEKVPEVGKELGHTYIKQEYPSKGCSGRNEISGNSAAQVGALAFPLMK